MYLSFFVAAFPLPDKVTVNPTAVDVSTGKVCIG